MKNDVGVQLSIVAHVAATKGIVDVDLGDIVYIRGRRPCTSAAPSGASFGNGFGSYVPAFLVFGHPQELHANDEKVHVAADRDEQPVGCSDGRQQLASALA